MDLTQKLTQTLEELKKIMEQRRARIKELQDEIHQIEAENTNLEDTISSLLKDF
jgi:predicted nuclease with TOPRIM domain